MTTSNVLQAVTYQSGEAIGLGVAAKLSGTADKTCLICTDPLDFIGVVEMAVGSGVATPVAIHGRVKVRTQAAITRGAKLTVHSDGRFKTAGTGNVVVARAEESCTAADQYITALLVGQYGAVA